MIYGSVPGVGKPVARVVQGTAMIRADEEENAFALLDEVFEGGGTAFDTAHQYANGDAERVFGRWVCKRGVRDEVGVVGKGAHHSRDRDRVNPFDITADPHDSLARVGFDHIDLYLLHRDDPSVPVGLIIETEFRANVAAAGVELTPQELMWLEKGDGGEDPVEGYRPSSA